MQCPGGHEGGLAITPKGAVAPPWAHGPPSTHAYRPLPDTDGYRITAAKEPEQHKK